MAAECSELEIPINGQYICNSSSQVLAKYFDTVTKEDGYLTFKYDLNVLSDYDIIIGFGLLL